MRATPHVALTTLAVLAPRGEEPIVFPRTGGCLDRTFQVSSGAAVGALGTVRHFDRAPQAFSVNDEGKNSCADGSQGAVDTSDGECENGKDAKTGQACTEAARGP